MFHVFTVKFDVMENFINFKALFSFKNIYKIFQISHHI